MAVTAELESGRREIPDALAAIEFYFEQGWTDGLPIVPPTEERVREFLEYSGHQPSDVVRAMRLILMNVCQSRPGVMDKSTLGHPGKYAYCIAENEVDSPWVPLHAERGLPTDVSAVTLFAAEAPAYVVNNSANRAEHIA